MKRLLATLLAGVLLAGLAGCQKPAPQLVDPSFTPLAVTCGTSDSTYDGMEIQIDSLNWNETENKTSLVVVWNNKTKHDVVYGAAYTVERLEDGEWISCAMKENLAFRDIAYELKAGRAINKTYNLTGAYDVSSPGTYRFKAECYVYENTEQSKKCEIAAEFTVDNAEALGSGTAAETEVEWCAQYIRTNGGYEAPVLYPSVRIIHSLQELKDYYNTWREVFDLERKEQVYSDTTIGFLDACDRYDETFFQENYLIFVLLEEGSGSVRHEVCSVTQTADKQIAISIDRKVPEVGTDDMAQWHIVLELSRDVMVKNSIDTMIFLEGMPSYMDDKVVVPQMEGAYKMPPEGKLITPEGEAALHLGGYSWICALGNGLENATIADQAGRPLPKESLEPVIIDGKYAETVYAPVPGSDVYAPTNSLGYLLKLNWEVSPTSVTYTCWPEAVWQKSNTPEEAVASLEGFVFYAKPGGYVYEIVATWEDTGVGYHGTGNYYVYICDIDAHCAESPV